MNITDKMNQPTHFLGLVRSRGTPTAHNRFTLANAEEDFVFKSDQGGEGQFHGSNCNLRFDRSISGLRDRKLKKPQTEKTKLRANCEHSLYHRYLIAIKIGSYFAAVNASARLLQRVTLAHG